MCTCIRRHLKETIPSSSITWSEMGKQNIQAKKVYCLMNLKNSGDSTGFEPMTSAMPVQCSNQLRYEVTQWRAGQFVACVASVSVLFQSKERPRNEILGFGRAGNETRGKK